MLGEGESEHTIDLYSGAAFDVLSLQWIQMGRAIGYAGNFSWVGYTVLQSPEDLIRLEEVPDIIVETDVTGSLLMFSAMLCQALGSGRVIGIDRDNSCVREATADEVLHSVDRVTERELLARRLA